MVRGNIGCSEARRGGAPCTSIAGRLLDAPEAIHNSMTLISDAVSGGLPSVGMKSFSSGDKLIRRNSSLCFGSPGFMTFPSFPPRITFSKLSSWSFPFLFCALWQLEHLFSKIGATRAAKNVTDDAELPFSFVASAPGQEPAQKRGHKGSDDRDGQNKFRRLSHTIPPTNQACTFQQRN